MMTTAAAAAANTKGNDTHLQHLRRELSGVQMTTTPAPPPLKTSTHAHFRGWWLSSSTTTFHTHHHQKRASACLFLVVVDPAPCHFTTIKNEHADARFRSLWIQYLTSPPLTISPPSTTDISLLIL